MTQIETRVTSWSLATGGSEDLAPLKNDSKTKKTHERGGAKVHIFYFGDGRFLTICICCWKLLKGNKDR